MGLRVPAVEVFHESFARRVGSVEIRVGLGRAAECLLPERSPLEVVCVLERMPGFVSKQTHALDASAPLHLEHHLPFQPHQPGVREIEWHSDAGNAVWRAPLIAQPEVDTKPPQPRDVELFAKAPHAVFEPRIGNGETELAQANVEELLGWQTFPVDGHSGRSLKDLSARDNSLGDAQSRSWQKVPFQPSRQLHS